MNKIVTVAGQEFSVSAETDNEAIRQQLVGMGFADVATATIKVAKRTVDGVEQEVVEFVKRAGTKGLTGSGLARLLRRVPAADPARIGPSPLLARLMAGKLTCEQVANDLDRLRADLRRIHEGALATRQEGETLCHALDALPAEAVECAW